MHLRQPAARCAAVAKRAGDTVLHVPYQLSSRLRRAVEPAGRSIDRHKDRVARFVAR
jgi:hypothetical protein